MRTSVSGVYAAERLHRDPARRLQRADPGALRQSRLRAGQGRRGERGRRHPRVPGRLRALGHGG
ncbi:hypothetical protein ACFSTC_55885 [Nonomuraea ferruginea]